MVTLKRSARARSQLFVLGVVVLGVGWLGCATNGDPAVDDPGTVPTSTATTSRSDGGGPRPDFEAGFPDAGGDTGNVDPTPDGGDTCLDPNDPGGNEATAKQLPDTDDSQNTAMNVQGIISSSVDVDFYAIKVADTFGHELQPDLAIATSGAEMCVYVSCITGATNFKGCSTGSVQSTSGIGDLGCCAAGPGSVNPSWSCGGITQTNDSAQLYIRIKQTADKCLSYAFSYAF